MAAAFGQTTPDDTMSNNVMSNYYIGIFQGGATYFPYALDKCQASGLTTPQGYMFSCSDDGMWIRWDTYGDNECTTSVQSTQWINSTHKDGTPFGYDTTMDANRGKLYAFECNGVDAYTTVTFNPVTCDGIDESGATLSAALDVCANLPQLSQSSPALSLSIWCDGTEARMQYYVTATTPMCDAEMTTNTNYADTESCDYIFTFAGTTQIYGIVNECMNMEMDTTTTSTSTTSAPGTTQSDANIHVLPLITFLFVIVFSFFNF